MSTIPENDAEGQCIQGIVQSIKEGLEKIVNKPQSAPKVEGRLNDLFQLACWLSRVINPFLNIPTIVKYGLWFTVDQHVNENELVSMNDVTDDVKDDLREIFDAAIKHCPDLVKILVEMRKMEDKYEKLLRCMGIHYRKARSDDTNSLGDKAGAYIPRSYGRLEDKSLLGDRHKYGYENKVTACMLCPCEKLEFFDQDPVDYMRKLRNKEVDHDDTYFATCFYDEKKPYDPDAEDKGLLQSEFLLKCFVHLYCRPNVAKKGLDAPKSRPSKGDVYKMAGATPETIAYVVCQAIYLLSSASQWSTRCLDINLEELRRCIVGLFRGDEIWAKETIGWWNSKLRFKASGTANNETDKGHGANAKLNKVQAQREHRHAAASTPPPSNNSTANKENKAEGNPFSRDVTPLSYINSDEEGPTPTTAPANPVPPPSLPSLPLPPMPPTTAVQPPPPPSPLTTAAQPSGKQGKGSKKRKNAKTAEASSTPV